MHINPSFSPRHKSVKGSPETFPRRFKILALDVDGTLLDGEGVVRPRTAAALAAAAAAGIQPVLCTGRRYRRARPIAEQLGLNAPIVCNSGALVKDPSDHRSLWRADFHPLLAAALLELFHEHGQPAVIFSDGTLAEADFVIPRFPTGRPLFDDYVVQNRAHAEIAPERSLPPQGVGASHLDQLFHICAIGTRDEMVAFQDVVRARLGGSVQTFVQRSPRYLGTMCEVIRRGADKWTAIRQVAALWGVEPGEICAVGDDVNDLPMIENAGLGVAMGHAPPEVLAAADLVTSDHREDGLAAFLEGLLNQR